MSSELHENESMAIPALRNDLIEINDPEIDPQEIIVEIRRRMGERREQLGYDERTFPEFGGVVPYPEPPDDLTFSSELYYHLRQANNLYADVDTESVLASSTATRLPFIGPLWKLIRRQAHGLVLFYVNRGLAHQVNVNRHLVSVLNQLVLEDQENQRTIRLLQAEIDEMKARNQGQ